MSVNCSEDLKCIAHSGVLSDLEVLRVEQLYVRNKVDGITNKLNTILGALVVSLILLVINLTLTK